MEKLLCYASTSETRNRRKLRRMKIFKIAVVIAFLFFPTFVGINAFRFGYNFEDAVWRTFLDPIEGTIWPPNFNDADFSKIRIGMHKSEVRAIAGKPLREECEDAPCFWRYTELEAGLPGYDQRWVVFDSSDRVIEIRKTFYLD